MATRNAFDTPSAKEPAKKLSPHLVKKKKQDKISDYLTPKRINVRSKKKMPTRIGPPAPILKPKVGDLSKIEVMDLESRVDALLSDMNPDEFPKYLPIYKHEGIPILRDSLRDSCPSTPPYAIRAAFQSPRSVVMREIIDLCTPERAPQREKQSPRSVIMHSVIDLCTPEREENCDSSTPQVLLQELLDQCEQSESESSVESEY
jgi:hypothetical protein